MLRVWLLTLFVPWTFSCQASEFLEFRADGATNLVVPEGQAAKIQSAAYKGDAALYMKFQLNYQGHSTEIIGEMLSGLYLNGPATLIPLAVLTTNTANAPYKVYSDSYSPFYSSVDTNRILLADTNGNFTRVAGFGSLAYSNYLSWVAVGNKPIPVEYYTGTNLAGSGILMRIKRYTNQPFRTLVLLTNQPTSLAVANGRRLVIPQLQEFGFYGTYGGISIAPIDASVDGSYPYSGPPSDISGGFFDWMIGAGYSTVATVRGGYPINLQNLELEGPEELTLTYQGSPLSLGAGGSAATTTGSGWSPSLAILTYYYEDEYSEVPSDSFVAAIADRITASSGNFGIATKSDLTNSHNLGIQEVISSPSVYGLFTAQQIQVERVAGQNDVLASPNSFDLYSSNQIHQMSFGGIVLNRNTNQQFVLNYQILQSPDLQNWSPYLQQQVVITNAPPEKIFLRFKPSTP